MSTHDLIIIGAGITGASVARELSRYRLKILVLEREEEPAFGVSKSNSGIIHPGIQNPPGSLKGRLCVAGNRLVRTLARELGVDFKEVGELVVAFTEADLRRLRQIEREGIALGVPRLRMVDREWLRRNEPNLNREIIGALLAPSAGIISPYRFVYDLCENAARNGVRIETGARVEAIGRTGGGFEVSTSRGIFRSRFIANCAGLFADEIARMVGILDFSVRARKGEEFLLDKKRQYLTNRLIFPLPQQNSKGILIIKTADGNPMIGPTAHETDDKNDLSTSDAGLREVLDAARRLVPSIDAKDIIAYFAGLRPTVGEDFLIRREPAVPGMITVAGIQSPGLTAASAIAPLVAGLLREAGLRLRRKIVFYAHRPRSIHLFSIPPNRTKALVEKDPAYGDIVCRCEMVSAQEVRDAIRRGARTLDGIKFRTRAQAGRCHGGFCTTRLMKILAEELSIPVTAVTKRGAGSQIVTGGPL